MTDCIRKTTDVQQTILDMNAMKTLSIMSLCLSQSFMNDVKKGIYLNIPYHYYLSGNNRCGMGYKEVNWSLPREQQVIIVRQNIYDGTYEKIADDGLDVCTFNTVSRGGEATTIEPL